MTWAVFELGPIELDAKRADHKNTKDSLKYGNHKHFLRF